MNNEKAILLRLSKEDDKFIKQEADKLRMTKTGYLRHIAITEKQQFNLLQGNHLFSPHYKKWEQETYKA